MITHLLIKAKNDIVHAVPFKEAVIKAGANLSFNEEVNLGVIRHIQGPMNDRDFHDLCSNPHVSSVQGILFGYGECVAIPPNVIDLPLREIFKRVEKAQTEGLTTLDLTEESGSAAYEKWAVLDETPQQTSSPKSSFFGIFLN